MKYTDACQYARRHGGGGGGGEGALAPPYVFFFVSSAVEPVMAMIVPLPHHENLLEIFLKSGKTCVGAPPPPPPPLSDFFRACATFMARAAVAKHFGNFAPPPPPKQTPWRRPCQYVSILQS